MKTIDIMSQQLPDIDGSVKECVNSGQWLLFRSLSEQHHSAYLLKAGSEIFALDNSGKIIEKLNATVSGIKIDELFYFSDLPRPASLSNLAA